MRPDPRKTARERAQHHFDAAYYARWYDDIETRSAIAERGARFVLSYVDHLDSEVGTVLDVGCGLGLWRKAFKKLAREVRYTGIEVSPYLCEKFGWQRADVRTYASRRRFDLVICQGVLQYLGDKDCARAIDNLARLTRRFLYLEVLTADDVREVCAPEGTDLDVFVRHAKWYARRLAAHFVNLGGGLYVKPSMRAHYYELWRSG